MKIIKYYLFIKKYIKYRSTKKILIISTIMIFALGAFLHLQVILRPGCWNTDHRNRNALLECCRGPCIYYACSLAC